MSAETEIPGHVSAAREIVRLLEKQGRVSDGALSTLVVSDEIDGPAFRVALEVLEGIGLVRLNGKTWRLTDAKDHHRTS